LCWKLEQFVTGYYKTGYDLFSVKPGIANYPEHYPYSSAVNVEPC